jgi:hypothetical protein
MKLALRSEASVAASQSGSVATAARKRPAPMRTNTRRDQTTCGRSRAMATAVVAPARREKAASPDHSNRMTNTVVATSSGPIPRLSPLIGGIQGPWRNAPLSAGIEPCRAQLRNYRMHRLLGTCRNRGAGTIAPPVPPRRFVPRGAPASQPSEQLPVHQPGRTAAALFDCWTNEHVDPYRRAGARAGCGAVRSAGGRGAAGAGRDERRACEAVIGNRPGMLRRMTWWTE